MSGRTRKFGLISKIISSDNDDKDRSS